MLIAILDDDERRQGAMRRALDEAVPQCETVFFDNAPDMLSWLAEHLADATLLCLDHDLGPNRERDGNVFDPGTGREVVDYLVSRSVRRPVVVHTSNVRAAPGMVFALEGAGWAVRRVFPFEDLEWIETAWIEAVVHLVNG